MIKKENKRIQITLPKNYIEKMEWIEEKNHTYTTKSYIITIAFEKYWNDNFKKKYEQEVLWK